MTAIPTAFADLARMRATTAQIDPMARVAAGLHVPDDVVVQCGAVLPANLVLSGACRIGPNAVFVEGASTSVGKGVVVGANATLMPGITLAARCVVRPGAVVTRSVPPRAIVEGNPAVIVGYADVLAGPPSQVRPGAASSAAASAESLPVAGVTLHHLPVIPDLRGSLTVGEFHSQIPFEPRRYFIVFGVPSREVRGEHAHRACHQFLLCVRGSCSVVADDGHSRVEVVLDAPHRGLYLPPMTWGIQYKYSPDAMLVVFASHPYDAADYIRDYEEFLALVRPAVEAAP
jgi:UDP-2-acetamido-3-amino-2,3-dideoxy-glucuronate N-acetyltransferase